MTHPSPWCSCDECARWRGDRRIPMYTPIAELPPLTWLREDIDRAMTTPFDEVIARAWKLFFPKGSRAGLPLEWTSDDLDLLRALKIDPWK